jgi:hypothetical protein
VTSGLAEQLEEHVVFLAGLGEKSTRRPKSLTAAMEYIERQFGDDGLRVERQKFQRTALRAPIWTPT